MFQNYGEVKKKKKKFTRSDDEANNHDNKDDAPTYPTEHMKMHNSLSLSWTTTFIFPSLSFYKYQ